MTTLQGSVVLVTGANGGMGGEFVRQALERGATKVYASARSPQDWDDPRIVALTLDTTDETSASAAAVTAADATIVINNAGTYPSAPLSTAPMDDIRAAMETNFFGSIIVARAFAPVLATHGGGALVNVGSMLGWMAGFGAYSASKAALWSATNSLRLELAGQDTHVMGLYMGPVDTPMLAHRDINKSDPADIVRAAYDGLEAGAYEVLADQMTIDTKAGLSDSIEDQYPQLGLP
ncbi:SDR family oxidoreductase [soil metagenome]